nr:MAG TPA: hypothetical protein [Caudoviricetes sp.]
MCGFRCRHFNRCGMPCIGIFLFQQGLLKRLLIRDYPTA